MSNSKKYKFFARVFSAAFLFGTIFSSNFVYADEIGTENQVVSYAETKEQALEIADIYNIELISYSEYGTAVFTAPSSSLVRLYSSCNAILPELTPNTKYELYDSDDITSQYHHNIIDSQKAWDYSQNDGADITVAILDTGIDTTHLSDEFLGKISPLSASVGINGANDYDIGAEFIVDTHSHGTHVAGLVGAAIEDYEAISTAVSGVAPSVDLLIVKIVDQNNSLHTSDIIDGIYYAVDNGADIINASFGSDFSEGITTLERTAYDYAYNHGVTVVCAAGNSLLSNASYPAALDKTIAVSAVNQNATYDSVYSKSNFGPQIDISAPGANIYSSILNGEYGYKSGTSMACPIVTGVCALVLADNPNLSPDELKTRITTTASDNGDLGKDDYYGYGVVNAYAALLGTENLLTATYYDDETKLSETKVANGNKLYEPNEPTSSHEFLYWATEDGEEFDFSTEITQNINLYAKWTKDVFETPLAPVLSEKTETSVTLTEISGAEYGYSSDGSEPISWQDSTLFSDLDTNNTYYFFARIKATSEYDASLCSPALAVSLVPDVLDFSGELIIENTIYGNTWSEIFDTSEYSATLGTNLSGEFSVKVSNSQDTPTVGNYTYEVLFTDDNEEYKDILVDSGTVTISPLEVEISWSNTELIYTGSLLTPSATIDNKVFDDDLVSVSVSGGQTNASENAYEATVTDLIGDDAYNYALPADTIKTNFTISKANSNITPTESAISATYGDTIELGVKISANQLFDVTNPDLNQVSFYYGDDKLGEVTNITDLSADIKILYDTSDKLLDIGENTISVYYGGNDNLNATNISEITVDLEPKELTNAMISDISAKDYTGEQVKPAISFNDLTLTLDEDYEVTYSDNINPSESATATIKGINYYSGEVTKTFTINDAEKVTPTISLSNYSKTYDASEIDVLDITANATAKFNDADVLGEWTIAENKTFTNVSDSIDSILVTFTPTDDTLYNTATTEISVSILAKEVTITAQNKTAKVGDSVPSLTYTASGFLGDDELLTAPEIETSATMATAGSFAITVKNATVSDNYSLTYVNGSLVISTASSGTIVPSGGGGGGGGGGSLSAIEPETAEITTLKPSVSQADNTTKATVSYTDIKNAVSKTSETIELEISLKDDTTALNLELSNKSLKEIASDLNLEISCDLGLISMSNDVLSAILDQTDDDVIISISKANRDDLTKEQQKILQNNTVYNLTITSNGENITSFDGNDIEISIPFLLKDGQNADYIDIFYVDDNGKLQEMSSSYDEKTELLTFNTPHFSCFITGYNPFDDINCSDFYFLPTLWAYDENITKGKLDTLFMPDTSCTRAEVVTFLWRASGSPNPQNISTEFTDLDDSAYYYDAVLWAVEKGITNGTGDFTFSPNMTCTRGQIVTFLWNFAGKEINTTDNLFNDVLSDTYYYDAVLWAVNSDITDGISDDIFAPNDTCSRGQVVTFLYRYFND